MSFDADSSNETRSEVSRPANVKGIPYGVCQQCGARMIRILEHWMTEPLIVCSALASECDAPPIKPERKGTVGGKP